MSANTERAIEFLRADMLRNIVPLKMLSLYPSAAACHFHQDVNGAAALVLLPADASPYDRQAYPDVDFVVLIGATSQPALADLLALVPRGARLVFKLSSPADRATIASQFALRRVTAFHSYTAAPGQSFERAAEVRVADQLDPACLPLLAEAGHAPDDLAHYFAAGALALAIERGDAPAATCFAHQNFETIYEIAGVYTRPAARRQGLGSRLVAAALYELAARGLTPRYQVHEINHPSIALAESLGLRRFVTIEHWLTDG
jgi:GNAT superfamily N-acetyltransferase